MSTDKQEQLQPPTTEQKRAWLLTKSELELELEKATYNTWVRHVQLHGLRGEAYILSCKNQYAVDWIRHRLADKIERLFSYMLKQQDIKLEFVVPPPPPAAVPAAAADTSSAEEEPTYIGFPAVKENWTRTPDYFYYEILCSDASPSTKILVAQVIYQTLGHVSLKNGKWREWWPNVTYEEITELTGIKHRGTIKNCIEEAVRREWLKIRERGRTSRDLALRYQWDELNNPRKLL